MNTSAPETITPAAAETSKAKPASKKPALAPTTAKAPRKTVAQAKNTPKAVAQPKPVVEASVKPKKVKMVRDSFTMPEDEYAVLSAQKKACLKAGMEVKKTELLRIALALLAPLSPQAVAAAQAQLTKVNTGRPKK